MLLWVSSHNNNFQDNKKNLNGLMNLLNIPIFIIIPLLTDVLTDRHNVMLFLDFLT